MKRRSNLVLYLILNVIVSAATTVLVLNLWDRYKGADIPPPPAIQGNSAGTSAAPGIAQGITTAEPDLTATLPPIDQTVIQIQRVVGAGDLNQEVVLLKRVGEGNLRMVGWRITGENGNTYTFPEQPELTLYEDGAVQVFSRVGDDTATEVYWDREEPAWQRGETIELFDTEDNSRAVFRVP